MMDDFDFSDMGIDFNEELDSQDISGVVNDGVDLEGLLYAISKYRDETEFLKKLKAKRVAPIDEKLKRIERNEEYLKKFILEAMPKLFGDKQTNVDFPGVGKFNKRGKKGKWVVSDKDAFVALVEKMKLDDDVIKIEKKVVAKFLPMVAAEILKNVKPDDLKCVGFEEPDSPFSLAITIAKPKDIPKVDTTDDDEVDF